MQKNTNSWHARKGDLYRAFHLDVPIVPSSVTTAAANDECLTCGDSSLGKTIRLGSYKFITDKKDQGRALMGEGFAPSVPNEDGPTIMASTTPVVDEDGGTYETSSK
jgi:hypothetical protein